MKKSLFLLVMLCCCLLFMVACGADEPAATDEPSGEATGDAGEAAEGETYVLRASTHQTNGSVAVEVLQACVDEIYERTEGAVEIEIYSDSLLGDWEVNYEDLMKGTLDIGMICFGSTYDPRMALNTAPCTVGDYDELALIFQEGGWMDQTLVDICAETGVKYMGTWMEGMIAFGSTKEVKDPFVVGADKGLLARCPGTENNVQIMEMLGYSATVIPFADLFTSLQTGVCDGWVGGTAYLNYTQFRDVVSYWYTYNCWVENCPFVMSQQTVDKLPAEYVEIIEEVFRAAAMESCETVADLDAEYLQLSEDYGITIINPTDEERATITSAIRENVWPMMEEELTPEVIQGMLDWCETAVQ